MGVYSGLGVKDRGVVNEAFSGASEDDIRSMGLPPLKSVRRDALILFPGEPRKVAEVLEDYVLCVAVRRLGSSMSPEKISQLTGLRESNIKHWRKSPTKALGIVLNLPGHEIPEGESPDFASFLGLVLSSRGKQMDKSNVIIASADPLIVSMFDEAVERLRGVQPRKAVQGDVHCRYFNSRKVHSYLRLATSGQTHLPLQHLFTWEERHDFLRSWLSHKSTIDNPRVNERGNVESTPIVEVQKKVEQPEDVGVLEDLRVLLYLQGFVSTMVRVKKGYCAIRILDPGDHQALLDGGYIVTKRKRDELEEALEKSRGLASRKHSRRTYLSFKWHTSHGKSTAEAGRLAMVEYSTAHKWARRGIPSTDALEAELQALVLKKNPDTVALAYRALGADPTSARKLAGEYPLNELCARYPEAAEYFKEHDRAEMQRMIGRFGGIVGISTRVPPWLLEQWGYEVNADKRSQALGPTYQLARVKE